LLLITYMYNSIANIGLPNVFIYGAFIFLTVYSYTELMDTRKISLLWEAIRFFVGIAIVAYLGDWFGMNTLFPFASYIIIGYLVLSLLVTFYFVNTNFDTEKSIVATS
jgi:alkylglycerol monooxygenase